MSTNKQNSAAIGAEIKQNRLANNLSIEEVSKKLRINTEYLQKIESGDMGFLPLPYVRAFVKSYAEFLNMDAHALLDLWQKGPATPKADESVSSDEIVLEKHAPSPKEKSIRAKKIFQNEIIVGAGLAAVVIIIILISTFTEKKPPEPQINNAPEEKIVTPIPFEQVLQEVNKDSVTQKTEVVHRDREVQKEALNLRIEAIDSVWVKVIIDDTDESEAIFTPGHVKSYRALKHFSLQIGNAGGIKMYLNEKELQAIGQRGQVRFIQIDQSGIHPYRRNPVKPAETNTELPAEPVENDSLEQQ